MSSPATPSRGTPPKRLTLTPGPRPLHLGTGSFPSPSLGTSSPLATPPTTAPLPPRRLGSVSHITRDDLATEDDPNGRSRKRSSLVRTNSLREVGPRRGHGTSASVAVGGGSEGALERAQREALQRKRMSASSVGTEEQPTPVLTLAEKHKDLLHFIAQKEAKCTELRAQLATHEADLLQLKKKWEKIVAKGTGQRGRSSENAGLGLGRLDATGAVDLVRGIFGGLGELAAPSNPSATTPATPSSSSSVSTPNHMPSPLPSSKPTLVTKIPASRGHLAHTPQSSSSSNSTALSSGTTATRLSLSSVSSLGGIEQLRETKETAEPVGEDEDMDAWGPFESVQSEEPESAGALGLSGIDDKAGGKPGEQNPSWVPTAVGKKWDELKGTETYAKHSKRASTILSDVSSAFATTLNALAPPPTASLTRPNTNVGGISPRPSPSIKLTTPRSKPSTPSRSSPAPISTSARPTPISTQARPVSLLDDDDGDDGAALGAVLQPSPSVSTRSKLSDVGSGKMESDAFGEDWNW
ncbi:hypothetical protein RhiJN_10190 [Ceratobasidium sp. AG-Ba]|nr:hypothetical protein RhiJN_10190 [Ceratobasidium sp. AG-Ba]